MTLFNNSKLKIPKLKVEVFAPSPVPLDIPLITNGLDIAVVFG
jgi:hypothetical protein